MNDQTKQSVSPVLESARLLRELHVLTILGRDQWPEADAIRDQMETPWYAMTPLEQERIGGLSEDLYALAEGGPPSVAMNERQIQDWRKELLESKDRYARGDIDAWLAFLRKPRPNNAAESEQIPRSVIHFFQAQCWDYLGDHETAALFRAAAEKFAMEHLIGNGSWLGVETPAPAEPASV